MIGDHSDAIERADTAAHLSAAASRSGPSRAAQPAGGSLSIGCRASDRDINDVYVFPAAGNRTVLAMTTHPAVNTPINAFKTYATNVRYTLNVDRNGDAVQEAQPAIEALAALGGGSERP